MDQQARRPRGDWKEIEDACKSLIAKATSVDSNAEERLAEIMSLLAEVKEKIESMGDPEQKLKWLKARLKEIREAASFWGTLKQKGVEVLPTDARRLFDKVDQASRTHGLFIVPAGQREAWLTPDVSYTRNKTKWTEAALKYIASSKFGNNHRLMKFVTGIREYCLR